MVLQNYDANFVYSSSNQNFYFKQSPSLESTLHELGVKLEKPSLSIRQFLLLRFLINVIKKVILSNCYLKYSKDKSKKVVASVVSNPNP